MTALATSTDVVAVLGRALTADEAARVAAELDRASAFIRAATRRAYAAGPFTVQRRVRDSGTILLDAPASVTSISEVDCDGSVETLSDWTLRGSKVYGLPARAWVEVVYAGDATVPDALVSLCAELAAVGLANTVTPGLKSITKGPFSETYTDDAHGIVVSTEQALVLKAHTRPRLGSVSLL